MSTDHQQPALTRHVGYRSVRSWLQAEIPVFVPCFNNLTYVRNMTAQLIGLGFKRVVLIDNASTSAEMREWLSSVEGVEVIALNQNLGPHHFMYDPGISSLLPGFFCVTDPDLAFNPALPEGFLGDLAMLTSRHKVGKAGFALDISDRGSLRDELFEVGGRKCKIWEWESQFWERTLPPTPGGDPVYDAGIDTTFALYDMRFFDPSTFLQAVRVAGRFTARHLPWYRDRGIPELEEAVYQRTQRFSSYIRPGPAGDEPLPGQPATNTSTRDESPEASGLTTPRVENPTLAEPSLNAIRAAAQYLWAEAGRPAEGVAPFTDRARDMAVSLKQVMTDLESLGGHWVGCEVGVVQRYYGVETLGLLRWAEMTPRSLTSAMEAQFEGVGRSEHTVVFTKEGGREYLVRDRRFGMDMHSFVQTDQMIESQFFATACKRLRFLREKLLADLGGGSKLFVFKSTDVVMTDEELRRLRTAMAAIGRNSLLYVRIADPEHPAPSVEDHGDGLLIGYIDKFQTPTEHNVTGWTQVLHRGWKIWKEANSIHVPQAAGHTA